LKNGGQIGMSKYLASGLVSCVAAILVQTTMPACADACDPYVTAMVKFEHTPHIKETTLGEQTGGGHFALATKTIFTGDALYEWKKDAWTKTETSGDQQEKSFREAQGRYTISCRSDGGEAIDGDIADIVATHSESATVAPEPVATDQRIWISRKSGLPLKEEEQVSITNPGGNVSSVKFTTRYEYDDVRAPRM
jgi:hypothetical protein